jgi:hypothetical protein
MATEKMSVKERRKFLLVQQERYLNASRSAKSAMLDAMETDTSLHRKHLIRLMNSEDIRPRKRNRERSCVYGPDVYHAVRLVADTLDWIGADRVQPCLADMAQRLERFGHLTLTPALLSQLQMVSTSTVRRIMKRIGRPPDTLPQVRRGRRADSVVQAMVPVGVIPWHEPEPGHFEADLVYHTANGLDGPFVCSLHLVDVLTGWSERFAILGHEFDQMWQALEAFRARCPIPVREIHTDNGSEFMNIAFLSLFGPDAVSGRLTRGRPGSKNDNRFVEQKNSSLIRAYLGRLHLHTVEQCALLDHLYSDMWRYYNLFVPVVRQTSRRVKVAANGLAQIVRTQDRAATPLERLLSATPPISRRTTEQLVSLREVTDPLALKRHIHRHLGELAQLAQRDERREAVTFR